MAERDAMECLMEEEVPCPSCGHVHPVTQSCEAAIRIEKIQAAIDRQEERDAD